VPPPPPNPVTGRDGFDNLTYSAVNNRVISPGFLFDHTGNQTRAVIDNSGTAQQYRYDCANRLVQVSDGSGNVLATHAYGAGNRRLMSVEGGVTKYFAWAGGQIIAEYEAWGASALIWKTSYVYMGGQLLATTSGIDGTETRFHHPDRLGTRLSTALDGTVVSEQFTMPFGNMQPFTSVYGGENPYQNPTLSNPSKKRFTSYDRSEATSLDYAMNRFYSPQQGRFTQVDPIGMSASNLGNPQSLNLYSYCGNDPINHVDPAGLFFGKLFGWIGKAFKWVARVAAVVLAVAAVLALTWGLGAAVAIKLGLGAFKFALDGWGNSKWTRLLSAGIGAFFGFKLGQLGRTPNTFPLAEGAMILPKIQTAD
jgi:RHS repeat-associated protein